MSSRVELAPGMITWARQRAGLTVEDLQHRFKRLPEWEAGETNPTIKQLQDYAKAAHTPVGYLFLSEPPEEPWPLADFRRLPTGQTRQPSPDLLDVLYLCQQQQEWYRNFAISYGADPVAFVGSATVNSDVVQVADDLREISGFTVEDRADLPTWTDALRSLRQQTAEEVGILVTISGVVGSNTNRKLNPAEFRGFALSDPYAPLIFVNGTDSNAAQIFTIVHEVGHILLGESGVCDPVAGSPSHRANERWSDSFAAEYRGALYHRIEASPEDLVEESAVDRSHDMIPIGVSERFTRAVVVETLEGRTLYRDAFRMLGIRKQTSFDRSVDALGVLGAV